PELVDDPGKLVNRAVIVGADTGRMRAPAGYREGPTSRAAPRGRTHVHSLLDGEILEIERGVGALAFRDEVAAGNRERPTGVFLVPGQEDRDVGVLERAGGLHRAQGC